MVPTNRQAFKEFCLRQLGSPILKVNVDDQQVEDNIDKALYKYRQAHMDATEQAYLAHPIVASLMVFDAPLSTAFSSGETIIGALSNTHGVVVSTVNSTAIYFYTQSGVTDTVYTEFQEGEVVTGRRSLATGTIAVGTPHTLILSTTTANAFQVGETVIAANNTQGQVVQVVNSTALVYRPQNGTFRSNVAITGITSNTRATTANVIPAVVTLTHGDADNKYITLPDDVISVRRILPPTDQRFYGDILFDPLAQFNMSLVSSFTSGSIIPYVIGRQYQQLLSNVFRGLPGIRFQRHTNKLHIDVNWAQTFVMHAGITPRSWVIVDCDRIISAEEYPMIWSDVWLQEYTTALIKKQWGVNTSKFSNIALPGGVTINGRDLLADAKEELKDLELQLKEEFQLPPSFLVG